MEKLESAFLGSKDLIGIGKFHPGTSEESWSAFSFSIPTPSLDLGSFSTGFGYPQIQTFLSFASKLSWDEMLNAKECLFQQWEYVGEALGVLYGSVQRLQNANSKEERWQKYFITAFLNWRSSPCNRVQYFFGRDRNCYPWKIPLGVSEKGCLKPLIVFLGIKLWLSLGLLLPHSWSEKRLKQVLMEMPGSHLVFFK